MIVGTYFGWTTDDYDGLVSFAEDSGFPVLPKRPR